jgi:hypothetical protein
MKLSAAENRATGLGKLGKKGAKNHLDTLHVDVHRRLHTSPFDAKMGSLERGRRPRRP